MRWRACASWLARRTGEDELKSAAREGDNALALSTRTFASCLSGASGVAIGIRALEALAELGIESHLVMTKPAEMTIGYETPFTPRQIAAKADYSYAIQDIAAPIASGSFRTKGMLVAPCSVRTMSEIAQHASIKATATSAG